MMKKIKLFSLPVFFCALLLTYGLPMLSKIKNSSTLPPPEIKNLPATQQKHLEELTNITDEGISGALETWKIHKTYLQKYKKITEDAHTKLMEMIAKKYVGKVTKNKVSPSMAELKITPEGPEKLLEEFRQKLLQSFRDHKKATPASVAQLKKIQDQSAIEMQKILTMKKDGKINLDNFLLQRKALEERFRNKYIDFGINNSMLIFATELFDQEEIKLITAWAENNEKKYTKSINNIKKIINESEKGDGDRTSRESLYKSLKGFK